jgi:hypothetical protein
MNRTRVETVQVKSKIHNLGFANICKNMERLRCTSQVLRG